MNEYQSETGNKPPEARPTGRSNLGSITKTASRLLPNQQKILKFALQSVARELAPHHRIRQCMRALIPDRDSVEIYYRAERHSAYYRHLMRCGSVWVCPICASSISERRMEELKRVLGETIEVPVWVGDEVARVIHTTRYHLALATFTIPHRRGMALQSVLRSLERAYHSAWSGRWAVAFKARHNVVGTIRALEITHGAAGWHPHIHTLFIRSSWNMPRDLLGMELELSDRWLEATDRQGARADAIHGVDLRGADERAADYISKLGQLPAGDGRAWDILAETVKYPTKRGREDSATLWELLARYAAGDVVAGELWIEAQAVLKGKRYLVPSGGLWEKIRAREMVMEESAELDEEVSSGDVLLATLTPEEWRMVCRKDQRGEVIAVASTGDHKLLSDFLESIL